jgi:pimeloyl-ACP methyl ester carboxylesterase
MLVRCREAVPEVNDNLLNTLAWPWFRSFLRLEPDQYLSRVQCPALAITGEKDVQCPPVENLAAMERSLRKAGNTQYRIKTMPGLNHLFQTAESGSPHEYEQIPEIIAPEALHYILEWLNEYSR